MEKLTSLARLIRYYCISSTTQAGSGHPTSSLSAVDIMTVLMFGGMFRFNIKNPKTPNNDRLIFSKGHASPLFYSLWTVAGALPEKELMTLRTFGSPIEGHPTMAFPFTEVATGSLGQGLSVGVGMALNAKYLDKLPYKIYVLLGDSEMAEGSNWEAMQIASHYKLDNLVGIIDVNRLGQRGETMQGHDVSDYKAKVAAFGWHPIVIDGHDMSEIEAAFNTIHNGSTPDNKPIMVIAKTLKGKGVSFLENQEDWHGKTLKPPEAEKAYEELGDIDTTLRGDIVLPKNQKPAVYNPKPAFVEEDSYKEPLAPRKAYGHALVHLHDTYPDMVVLDAEVSNSTYAAKFKDVYPKRFFEMFIAEQNMVGVAAGLSARGKIPFVSTFASFFTRAVDQIRVSQYSQSNINFVGSHVGVSIGEDGPTQMGLEDIAIFRAILGSVVLSPADHISSEKCVEEMIKHAGICYMRTVRMDTEPLYEPNEEFPIGGSKTLRESDNDDMTIIATGVTLYEALKAYDQLTKKGVHIRVVDAYSIKPIDTKTLQKAAVETRALLTVEDHFADGGLGGAVRKALSDRPVRVHSLAVEKMPKSGKPAELLDYEEISAPYIVKKVTAVLKTM